MKMYRNVGELVTITGLTPDQVFFLLDMDCDEYSKVLEYFGCVPEAFFPGIGFFDTLYRNGDKLFILPGWHGGYELPEEYDPLEW